MSLPILETPIFDLDLPSGPKIKFRPFLVKEEKSLLMALEGGKPEDILETVRQIIQTCVVDPKDFNVDNLTSFDLEYLFLNMRARAIGEKVEPKFRCNNPMDVKDANGAIHTVVCGTTLTQSIDLLALKPTGAINPTGIIQITDRVKVKFKYPKVGSAFKTFREGSTNKNPAEAGLDFFIDHVELIIDGTQSINPKAPEITREELIRFFESMTRSQVAKIEEFFENTPKIIYDGVNKCPKCGFEHQIHLEGLTSFFD